MGYSLYSENGFVKDIASVKGYDTLFRFISTYGRPDVRDFMNTGKTVKLNRVIADIKFVLPDATDTEVRKTLIGLREGLELCGEVGIISE